MFGDGQCENLVFDRLGKEGTVKIIDFGNSEIITNEQESDRLIIGSLHYLPPELLSSKRRTKGMLFKGTLSPNTPQLNKLDMN